MGTTTTNDNNEFNFDLRSELLRYFSFWPFYLLAILFFLVLSFLYLRYTDSLYLTSSKIEIYDKAQDNEMALPTAMTIFNRSMINLENEIGVLTSFSMHEKVVRQLSSNIRFFSEGRINTSESHPDDFFYDYDFDLLINPEEIIHKTTYEIEIQDNKMSIYEYDEKQGLTKQYSFGSLSTDTENNELPFTLKVRDEISENINKKIVFYPFSKTILEFRKKIEISQSGSESDQLNISINYQNKKIAEDYLNKLMMEFNFDGIKDRQLEYKRTMDFVDDRSEFLQKQLNEIELSKQKFKEENDLTDIQSAAKVNIDQKYNYNAELFNAESQRDLANILIESIDENNFDLMPINIGIENDNINEQLMSYNLVVSERDKFLYSAGKNNSYVRNLERQLSNYKQSINLSLENYITSLDKIISNLEIKEVEFSNTFKNIPENEKILRRIERELEVKESLFLLLLQKREEAAINYAVVKPSIKIIDYARSSVFPIFPVPYVFYMLSVIFGIVFPTVLLYSRFVFDNKIHTKKSLLNLVNLPVIAEIPHIKSDSELNTIIDSASRGPLAESIRILITNLNYIISTKKNESKVILVTSSIKGEGKTIISINSASLLVAKSKKVLLIGADLRNPQLHRYLGVSKNETEGLSNYLCDDTDNWEKYLLNHSGIDIMLSGLIPPNPTEMLAVDKFKLFIEDARKKYDYILIDSAPCVLVSDTFEISKYSDICFYIIRSNYSDVDLTNFINECKDLEKLNNINLVLNGVGNSKSYGYKYGYQYGYKYGYNYGYGYGYLEDKK